MQKLVLPVTLCVVLSTSTLWAQTNRPSTLREMQMESRPSILQDPNSDVFVTILDERGQPLPGAILTYSDWQNAPEFVSDANGGIRLDRSLFTSFYDASFWITAPGYGSQYVLFHDFRNREYKEEKVEKQYTFRLSRNTQLSGIVLNEQKQPVANATVLITHDSLTRSQRQSGRYMSLGPTSTVSVTTDQNGKWTCNTIPGDVTIMDIKPSHPDYAVYGVFGNRGIMAQTLAGTMFQTNRADRSRFLTDFTQELQRGTDVTIRVVDESGQPVANAVVIDTAIFQQPRETQAAPRTNADGLLKLKNHYRGTSRFVVKAQGFALQGETINVTETPASYTFQMSRGHKLTLRVVDKNRQPVPDVQVSMRTEDNVLLWYDESIPTHTDANGIWIWEHAPNKPLSMSHLWKNGYMQTPYFQGSIAPDVNDVTMVMHKNLVLSGKVIDATTKQPIERFSIVHAIKYTQSNDWYFQNDISPLQTAVVQESPPVPLNPDGRFERTWSWQFESMYLRIKAPGYDVADSQAFRMGEEKLTFHFELTPNPNITGIASLPDGTPAAGAEIAVGSKGNPVYLFNGRIDRKRTPVVVTADHEGKFSFPAVDGQYTLVAMHNSGCAVIRQELFDIERKIKLAAFPEITEMSSFPGGKITTLTFGKGGQEPLDGYFIDIAYDPQQDATAKSRIIDVFYNRADGQTSLYVPLR